MIGKELLIEIYAEEIPPFELYRLKDFFQKELELFLKKNDISFLKGKMFATPRRVTYYSKEVSGKQLDKEIIVTGPYKKIAFDKDGNPTRALLGFLKSKNKTLDELSYQKDKKGERIFFKEFVTGVTLEKLLEKFIEKTLILKAPFKKSMKWGENSYTFIRPIHNILATYDNTPLNITFKDLKTNNETRGHLILAPETIKITDASKYEEVLEKQFVIADISKRKEIILSQIKDIEEKGNFTVKLDEGLLKEVVNIVEYPHSFVGTFDEKFLNLPDEALITSMKKHQKYFPVYKDNKLSNYFVAVANVDVKKDIINGNERVLRARLSDAFFFYDEDLKKGLKPLVPKLDNVMFQKKLGSYGDKIKRIKDIALTLNSSKYLDFNISEEKINEAADLIKVDLLTGLVSEFANLQGIAGYYYAKELKMDADIALAIKEHYQPKTINDEVPTSSLSILLSLADKLDNLVGGFWAGLAPTGSKDAFALRRTALGILKILTERDYKVSLNDYMMIAILALEHEPNDSLLEKTHIFIKDRFKHFLRNSYSSDIIEAVTDKTDVVNKTTMLLCKTLNEFKENKDSEKLITLIKRVTNILKSDLHTLSGEIDSSLLVEEEEKELFNWLEENGNKYSLLLSENRFEELLALSLTSYLPLDIFFEKVLVNDKNEAIKKNRQLLLISLYKLLTKLASLDKLKQ